MPIAIGLLTEEGLLDERKTKDYAFIGELSLDGSLRGVNGVLSLILGLKNKGIKNVFVPRINAQEAALAGDINIYGAETLYDVVNHFDEKQGQEVVVAGRIATIRSFGKLVFLKLRDASGEVQIFMKAVSSLLY